MQRGRGVGRVLNWVAFVVAPLLVAGVGIWLLYLASRVTNPVGQSCADRLFVFGVLLVVCGLLSMFVRSVHSRSHENRVLADRIDALARQMRGLERDLLSIRQDVDSRLAVKAWLKAFDQSDALTQRLWVEALEEHVGRGGRTGRTSRRRL